MEIRCLTFPKKNPGRELVSQSLNEHVVEPEIIARWLIDVHSAAFVPLRSQVSVHVDRLIPVDSNLSGKQIG